MISEKMETIQDSNMKSEPLRSSKIEPESSDTKVDNSKRGITESPSVKSTGTASTDTKQHLSGVISHTCIVSYKNKEGKLLSVELSYIGQDCYTMPSILGRIYGNQTRRLDLSYNSLRNLKGLEMFPFLEELILDNNCLNDTAAFLPLPWLHTLSLNKNKFNDLEHLLKRFSQCYPKLIYLSLLGNPACPDQLSNSEKDEEDYTRYRYYVLYHIPSLKFLDSAPIKDSERTEAKRVGPLMKVVKPLQEFVPDDSPSSDEADNYNNYSPLPISSKKEGTHKGSFGKLRQRYCGTQSEGNRFIKDNEL